MCLALVGQPFVTGSDYTSTSIFSHFLLLACRSLRTSSLSKERLPDHVMLELLDREALLVRAETWITQFSYNAASKKLLALQITQKLVCSLQKPLGLEDISCAWHAYKASCSVHTNTYLCYLYPHSDCLDEVMLMTHDIVVPAYLSGQPCNTTPFRIAYMCILLHDNTTDLVMTLTDQTHVSPMLTHAEHRCQHMCAGCIWRCLACRCNLLLLCSVLDTHIEYQLQQNPICFKSSSAGHSVLWCNCADAQTGSDHSTKAQLTAQCPRCRCLGFAT